MELRLSVRSSSGTCGKTLFDWLAGLATAGWALPKRSRLCPRLVCCVGGGDNTRGGGAPWLDARFFFFPDAVGAVAYCCGIDGKGGAWIASGREGCLEGDGEGVLNVLSVMEP